MVGAWEMLGPSTAVQALPKVGSQGQLWLFLISSHMLTLELYSENDFFTYSIKKATFKKGPTAWGKPL